MAPPRSSRIGEVLVKARVIDELQLRSAMAQHDSWGGRLAHVVAEMGLAAEERIVDTLAQATGLQRVRVGNLPRDPAALGKLDAAFAEENGVFPISLRDNGKVLMLAMADPTDLDLVDEVGRRARVRVSPFIAGEREIRAAIARHYRGQTGTTPPPPPRSRTAELPAGEEEFNLVDRSGIDPASALAQAASSASATRDLLDEILSGTSASDLSEEDWARLRAVQTNQQKSAKIVRAVMELLLEKRVLSTDELRSRLRS